MNVKQSARTGGFTLIELIVVIAILGILAGVGTVAYTGYVKRANKGVDQQMVTDVVNSIYYAWMANPNGMDSVGAVVLSTETAPSITGDAIKSGIQMAFGDESQLRLKYDWGNNSAVLANVAEKVQGLKTQLDTVKEQSGGTVDNISFINDSDQILNDMFDALTSTTATNIISAFDDDTSAANVLNSAALYTLAGTDAGTYALFTDGSALAGSWNTMDWESGFTDLGDSQVYYDVAAMGMNAARTYSLALYLQNNAETLTANGESSEDIQSTVNWLLGTKAAGNILSNMTNGSFSMSEAETGGLKAPNTLVNAVNSYFGANVLSYNGSGFSAAGGTPSASSQAYADGLGYAAAMTTIKDLSGDTAGMDDSTYFNTITGGVNTAVAMMNNTISDDDITNLKAAADGTGSNNVVVTVINVGGKLNISVSPADAYLGSVGEVTYENNGSAVIPEVPVQNSFDIVILASGNAVYSNGQSITSLQVPANSVINLYMAAGSSSVGEPVIFGNALSSVTISNVNLQVNGTQISGTSFTVTENCTLSGTWTTTTISSGRETARTMSGFTITIQE